MSARNIIFSIGLLIAMALVGCSSDSFELKVDLENLGTQNLRIIYGSDDAIHSMWMPAVDGKFTYHGNSKDYCVVEIFNGSQQFVTAVAVRNGQSINIKGDYQKPFRITADGNDINDELFDLLNENADDFEKHNFGKTDAAIEKFATKKGNEALATDMLIKYYYTRQSAADLLRIGKMRQSKSVLYASDGSDRSLTPTPDVKRITSFILYSNSDSIESFMPSKARASLIYFWDTDSASRKDAIEGLKRLCKTYSKSRQLQVADVALCNDSSIWKMAIRTDSVGWKQFWGLGGRMNNEVKKMGVKNAPYYLVSDSTGNLKYRGESLDAACASVDKILKDKK